MSEGAQRNHQYAQKEAGDSSKKRKAHNPPPVQAARGPLPPPDGGVDIDGSMLEGGGQILRNASALSAILRLPIRVEKIRAGRDKPGLRPQHLTGLELVAALCGGELRGGHVGSSCITLQPASLACSRRTADTRTAGSCMLLVQSALPCLLFAAAAPAASGGGGPSPPPPGSAVGPADPAAALESALREGKASQLDLRGGTDAPLAPPAGYVQHVLLPVLRARLGVVAELALERRGFFPRGQGRVVLTAAALPPGGCLPPIDLTERGAVTGIQVRAFNAGRLAHSIGDRLAAAACAEIKARLASCGMPDDMPMSTEVAAEPPERAVGDGCGVLVTARTTGGCVFGASGLGQRGVSAEDVGQRAAAELMDALGSGACCDEWLQDQLVVFMALAKGRSRVLTGEPTMHTRTACMVAEALTSARFSIRQQPAQPGRGELWIVECEGAGVAALG